MEKTAVDTQAENFAFEFKFCCFFNGKRFAEFFQQYCFTEIVRDRSIIHVHVCNVYNICLYLWLERIHTCLFVIYILYIYTPTINILDAEQRAVSWEYRNS